MKPRENLLVQPARAVNPQVKMVIKFPNWYEHFQGLGYDLDQEPRIFDGIYTGTETRDPDITDQHLQQYESYRIFRYFENISRAATAAAGWTRYSIRYLDRYAEQLWDTMFAKAPEMMLFNWAALRPAASPGRSRRLAGPAHQFRLRPHGADLRHAIRRSCRSEHGRVAGYSLEQVDAFLGKLGNPIGIKSYKPYQSTGEDFLHNYLGMIGIPIELYPDFPAMPIWCC